MVTCPVTFRTIPSRSEVDRKLEKLLEPSGQLLRVTTPSWRDSRPYIRRVKGADNVVVWEELLKLVVLQRVVNIGLFCKNLKETVISF